MSQVSVRDLCKTFVRAEGDLDVLDHVSFDVANQEFVCLLGPSGSGKSVSLNIVAGLLEASSGEVLVDGVPTTQKRPVYGYVFQQPRLLPWLSVQDNVRFALRAATGRAVPNEAQRIKQTLEQVGLSGYERFYPHQISGGMQQRVGIARAFSRDPELLLMDEPFSSLDEITARRLRAELIGTWSRNRKTVLFVTHDIAEASFLADKIVIYTPKPTRIARILKVDLPRPRSYGSTEVQDVERMVLNAFEASLAGYTAEEPV
jgi:ABC-type nitrate/sulfonate/bicarbonate transport system ATPase subunit